MTSAKAWVSAIFAGLSAGLASLAVVLVGDMTLADLTQGQWLAVAIAVVSAFGGGFGLTYSVTNKNAQPRVVLTAPQFDQYLNAMAESRKPTPKD